MKAINRRGFLALTACSTLAIPTAGKAEEGEGRIKTLDPRDPVAVELARLHDALLATHQLERPAYLAVEARYDRLRDGGRSYSDSGAVDEAVARLHDEHELRSKGRRSAYFALLHAVVEAAGGPELDPGRWMRYGIPVHVIKVGDRLYLVSPDSDALVPDEIDCYGFAAVNVVDL